MNSFQSEVSSRRRRLNQRVVTTNTNIVQWTPTFAVTNAQNTATGTHVLADDLILISNLTANITITLPTTPMLGEEYTISDRASSVGTELNQYQVTINGNGNNIESQTTYIMAKTRQTITLTWASTRWKVTSDAIGQDSVVIPVLRPVPPNNDMYRASWVFDTSDYFSDTGLTTLLNVCNTNGINLLFVLTWGYLDPAHWNFTNELNLRRLIHMCHKSGIEVHAMPSSGSDGYNAYLGNNQFYGMYNYIVPIQQYNERALGDPTYPDSKFDGIHFDNEWWASSLRPESYTSADVIGVLDFMKVTREALPGLKIGYAPTVYFATSTASKDYFTYDGYVGSTAYHLMNSECIDYLAVQCYNSTASAQITDINPYYLFASQPGINTILLVGTLCDNGASGSYNTGTPGNKATMLTAMTTISQNFTPTTSKTGTNYSMAYGGVCFESFASFQTIT